MNVLVKSSNGITQVSADAKLLSQRKVFIEGEISPETACEFIKKIIVLNAENQEKFIDVLINSPGGEINSGLAMYDVIQSSKAPVTLGVQISGFLFGFDVVPIFIGIQYKRLRQGLTKDKFILIMALIVCGLVFAMNIALRIMTIDLLSPSPASNAISYMGEVVQENTESNVGSTAIALTIFGMGIPVVTSLGSCLISFITYNPLNIKKRRIAEMIEDNRDDIRRFDAIIADYDAEPDFAKYLEEEDEAKYQEMKMLHRALVISHCDYVRERLKEHLGNPTSNNVLSESSCETILARLDKELGLLNAQNNDELVPVEPIEEEIKYKTMIQDNRAIA